MEASCEAETVEKRKGRNRRLSSRKESGSGRKKAEAEQKMPEKKRKQKRRQALVEQLWERSWEGRKETNRKPSTGTGIEGMRDQAGEKGESEEAKAEARTGKTTVR